MHATSRPVILPIFLTVFIDMLGVGIIIPVLPALFFEEGSMIFTAATPYAERSFLYGLLLASFPFMQFFGAPILGTLSDRYGRKPLLQISLAGTLIGYILFGTAILTHNLWLLFFSRMLPGFMGGNIAIIYSAIADVSDPQSKAKNFGLVGMAFGLGFILGPTIGGVLADPTVLTWFTPSTPFWFTSALTLINILFVQFIFKETLHTPRLTKFHPLKGVANIVSSFKSPNLRVIFSVVLLQALGFTFFTQFFSVVLINKIGAQLRDIGMLFGWIGVWLVFTQAIIVRYLSKRTQSAAILQFSLPALALAIAAVMLPDQLWLFYIINPFVAIFQGISAPNLTAVVSAQAGKEHQGEILGINQSMISVGQMLPAVIGGWLNSMNVHMPIVASTTFILCGWLKYVLIFMPGQRKLKDNVAENNQIEPAEVTVE
ncbi:MAG: MFS transporter [Saprospiraceae bacterium]|nr:MFS transporter [Saprospiraceae bacterium]